MNKPSLMQQSIHPPVSRGREFGRESAACGGTSGSMTTKNADFPTSICLPSVSNMSSSSGQGSAGMQKRIGDVPSSATAQQASKMVS